MKDVITTNETMYPSQKVLSISIAAYNVGKTLNQAIDSLVVNQNILDAIEIIIVNDGSTDSTSQIAHQYKNRYPGSIVVIDKENGGYGSTINASLKIASGKYFKLLDGDDWYCSWALTGFIQMLSIEDADLVINPFFEVRDKEYLRDDHSEIPCVTSLIESTSIKNIFFLMHELTVKTNMLRRSSYVITEHCYYTDTEYDMMCFICSDTIKKYEEPIYCYRTGQSGQSMSLSGIRQHYTDMIMVTKRIIDMYQRNNHVNSIKKRILENYVEHIILFTTYGILTLKYPSSKKEINHYEKMLKGWSPEAYKLSNKRKFLRVARTVHFRPFFLMRRFAVSQYE